MSLNPDPQPRSQITVCFVNDGLFSFCGSESAEGQPGVSVDMNLTYLKVTDEH
jgi:hypothetical protein